MHVNISGQRKGQDLNLWLAKHHASMCSIHWATVSLKRSKAIHKVHWFVTCLCCYHTGVPRRSSYCASLAGKASCQEVYQVTFTLFLTVQLLLVFSPTIYSMGTSHNWTLSYPEFLLRIHVVVHLEGLNVLCKVKLCKVYFWSYSVPPYLYLLLLHRPISSAWILFFSCLFFSFFHQTKI